MISDSQKNLIELVKKFGRHRPEAIQAGPEFGDQFNRKLKLNGQLVDKSGTKLSKGCYKLLKELQTPNSELENTLRGQFLWYDVRSSVWKDRLELSAFVALAYVQVLIERTGKKTGHIINVAVDCYPKHFESVSAMVDVLTRTGIFNDGGGIIYFGVQNGGTIRNVSQFQRAITGSDGNWIYGTMSHRAEDYVGAKFGMLGKVFCGPDLMEDLYGKLKKGDYPELMKIDNPNDFLVTVKDLTENNIYILEDLIRARTGTEKPRQEFLAGVKIGLNMCGSPVGKNLVDILAAFGADVVVKNAKLDPNFNTSNIVDPNEHESEPMEMMKKMAEKDQRIYLAVDPDGDRGTIIAKNSKGKAVSLTGSELLLLATENLVTYNPNKLPNDIIYDMRTGVGINLLAKSLEKKGQAVNLIAAEPGYPFFMENMGKNQNAAIAVENTAHAFMTPMTNPIWGASKYYAGVQGGDDAATFLTYLLALSKLFWEGRNPVVQLEYIQKNYGLPTTIIREFKPAIDKADAMRKYDLAVSMCEIAEKEIKPSGKFIINIMNSGVRLTSKETGAIVLIRYSNTGPSFTASGEAITQEDSDFMFKLGAAIMNRAVEKVQQEKGNFHFDWKDFSVFGDIPSEEVNNIIQESIKN